MRSGRDAELAKRLLEARLAVGRLLALPDDERAGNVELPGREVPLGHPGDHYRAWRDVALELLREARPANVDDLRRRGQHHTGAEYGLATHAHALDHDAATPDEGAVLDDHRCGAGRLEHATDPDAAGDVDVATDLRAGADRGPGVDHGAGAYPCADVDVARHQDGA